MLLMPNPLSALGFWRATIAVDRLAAGRFPRPNAVVFLEIWRAGSAKRVSLVGLSRLKTYGIGPILPNRRIFSTCYVPSD